MAEIIPFKGYRFNFKKVENLGNVMAPPYETILKEEQEELYNRNEYNIVRLNKGMQYEGDDEVNNCFTRAAKTLDEWIKKQVLVADEEPCFYLYEQVVTYKYTTYSNLGFIGLLKLQDQNSGNILQCEKHNSKSKPARKNLLKETGANFSTINCIYMEYEKELMNKLKEISEKKEPDMSFKTHETIVGEDVNQRVWAIKDEATIKFICQRMKNHTFYIADGQTRYEAGLEYKKECEKNNPNHTGAEPYNYIMALFTNAFDDGLIQLPVHRLIKSKKRFSEDFLIACAQDYFKVEKIIVDTASEDFVDTMKKQTATTRKENKFSIYCGGNYFYRLTLKDTTAVQGLLPDASEAYRKLDVTVLNKIILEKLLNITEEDMAECVTCTTRASFGIASVENKEFDCMIVVNPVRADQICQVAMAHERMPEKSMFIFPKASTGVVVYKMEK